MNQDLYIRNGIEVFFIYIKSIIIIKRERVGVMFETIVTMAIYVVVIEKKYRKK